MIKLTGGNSSFEGTLLVCKDGEWGTICDDNWDDLDAQVACRQLQLTSACKGTECDLSEL